MLKKYKSSVPSCSKVFDHPKRDYGLLCILMYLKWVRHEIKYAGIFFFFINYEIVLSIYV